MEVWRSMKKCDAAVDVLLDPQDRGGLRRARRLHHQRLREHSTNDAECETAIGCGPTGCRSHGNHQYRVQRGVQWHRSNETRCTAIKRSGSKPTSNGVEDPPMIED